MLRRTFIKIFSAFGQSLIALTASVPVIRLLLDPLSRSSRSKTFIRVADVSTLKEGVPTRVMVNADRRDAYVHYPSGPIGSVWLIKEKASGGGDDSVPRVRAWQTICPHLGCGIDFSTQRQTFTCPCHTSDFELTGQRTLGPSPRAMDELECRVTDPDPDPSLDSGYTHSTRWVEVAYQTFKTGQSEKQPIT